MELNKQIKKYRTTMSLSQEELAEKLYVTRQTISNWETSKSYPDIHSLLLMSTLFNITLDELIKGDLDIMKEEIKTQDMKEIYKASNIFAVLLCVSIIAIAPLIFFLEILGAVIAAILFMVTMIYAFKVEKYKKQNDVQTYKEILAFFNGEKLDEIDKQREYGKRPYQKFLLAIGCGGMAFVISILLLKLVSVCF